jgi:hypothetical protein
MSTDPADLPQDPSAGEMDVLAVLWEAREKDLKENNPRAGTLKLSEIHRLIGDRRGSFGEPPSALTTVSTYLRSATAKRLLKEVRTDDLGRPSQMTGIRTRGALSSTRSPRTAYQVAHEPGVVFQSTMQAIIQSYPPGLRSQALVDFARAMGLPQKTVKEVEKLIPAKGSA